MRPTITLAIMLLCVPASASVYIVDYNDFDAVHWTGEVDTDADTLTITSWDTGGSGYWTPKDFVWPAKKIGYSATSPTGWSGCGSAPYDLPDNWTPNTPTTDILDGVFFEAGLVAALPDVVGGWGGGLFNDQGCRLYGGGNQLVWGIHDQPIGLGKVTISVPDLVTVTPQSVPEPSSLLIFGLLSLGLLGVTRASGRSL